MMWFTRFDWTNVGLLYCLGIVYRISTCVQCIACVISSTVVYWGTRWCILDGRCYLMCLASRMLDVVYRVNS
jgi:hypothetical protein